MSKWFRCKIEGISKEQAKTYLTENSDGYVYFDFSKIVPVPDHLQFHNGLSLNDGLEMMKRHIMAVEFLKLLNIKECSACNTMTDMFSDWLAWTKENWDVDIQPIEFEIFEDCIYISTINAVPVPIFKKLSEILNTKIKLVYSSDVYRHDTGRIVFDCGKTVSEFYPENGSNEAARIFVESWYYGMEG